MTKKGKNKGRDKARAFLAGLSKSYDVTVNFYDELGSLEIERISCGNEELDEVIGGGLPRGRIIEAFGAESSSKSTFCIHSVASFQKEGLLCAYIDTEHAFDATYARNLGVVMEDLVVSQPDTAEQALNMAEKMAESGLFGLVIVDSIAAMVPKKMLEGEIGDETMGLLARRMSAHGPRIAAKASATDTTMIYVNQVRSSMSMYGPSEVTSGGKAMKFYASIRLRFTNKGKSAVEKDENKLSVRTKIGVSCVKNKTAPPFRECELTVQFGKGYDANFSILSMSLKYGSLKKSGAWIGWTKIPPGYEKANIAQGSAKFSAAIETDPILRNDVLVALYEAMDPVEAKEAEPNDAVEQE